MENLQIENIDVRPAFELEDFMNFAHETRISNEALRHLSSLWENWQNELRAARIEHGKISWLAIWLPEAVEKAVDKAWEDAPSEGFLINSLAQYICMAAVEELLPEAANGGCAPSPEPALALGEALGRMGLADAEKNDTNLLRRYAILTYFPFRGGCEICAMRQDCPKANGGGAEFATVTLPGHERGKS